MAGAAKTAYSTKGRAPATVPGRPRHPMAAAVWLAVVLAAAVAVVLTMFSLRGGPARHTTVVASMPYWNFQPRLLLLAVFFPFMRMLDAAISLYSVPAAWLSVSNGRWKSPARRPVGGATTASLPAAGVPARGGYHAGTSDEPGRPARVAEASHVSG